MACELTSAVESNAAAPPPQPARRWGNERPITERLSTLGLIAALHLVAILAIWTRHVLVDAHPAPLVVTSIDAIVPAEPPPPPPVIVPTLSLPPAVLAPPLPPTIEAPEEAPTAITAQQAPVDVPVAPPTSSSNLVEARFNVDYLNNPKPVYPALARRLGEEGVVILKVLVRSDGSVAQALINQRSGFQRLDEAALTTVKQWRFVPARHGNEPIESWVLVPIEFELQS